MADDDNDKQASLSQGDENKFVQPCLAVNSQMKIVDEKEDFSPAGESAMPMDANSSKTRLDALQQQQQRSGQQKNNFLSLLERDYNELDKKSVKGCLRSKNVPCAEVRAVLEKNQLNLLGLQKAYRTLTESKEHLLALQERPKAKSSLWYMTRIGTAVRLLQVLVLWRQDIKESSCMIGGLLETIVSKTSEAVKQWKSEGRGCTEGADKNLYSCHISESFHAPQVAVFALAYLLRVKSLFAEKRPDLLSGIWKFLEALAQEIAPHLPGELLQDIAQALTLYLKEFLLQMHTCVASPSQTISSQHLKLCTFFLTRLVKFIKISPAAISDIDENIMESVMDVLVQFMGFTASVYKSFSVDTNVETSLRESIIRISTKAECSLLHLLLSPGKGEQTTKEQIPLQSRRLQILLKLSCKTPGALGEPIYQSSTAALCSGSIQILIRFLQEAAFPKLNSAETVVPEVWQIDSYVQTILTVVEHLIFVKLPQFYELFALDSLDGGGDTHGFLGKLLEETLSLISSILYYCEYLPSCTTTNAGAEPGLLHGLLVRWFLPNDSQLHPLTRQTVFALIEMHSIQIYNAEGILPVLALLVKLFFDPRSYTQSRATIGALFRKILASPNSQLLRGLQQLIRTEYDSRRPPTGKKRKRAKKAGRMEDQVRGWKLFSLEDVSLLALVLSHMPISRLANSAHDVEGFCLRTFKSTKARRTSRFTVGVSKTAMVCFALIQSSIRDDSTENALKAMTGGLGVSDLQQQAISWFLGSWNSEFDNGRRRNADHTRMTHLAIQASNLLRLIAFSCQRPIDKNSGACMTHNQVEQVCQALSICVDEDRVLHCCKASETSPLSNLVFEVLHVLRFLGNVIPLDCRERTIQNLLGIFHRLLNTDSCWSLSAYTMTSLHAFSITLQQTHKQLLPACIPKRRRAGLKHLLQCRIQNTLYRYDHHKRASPCEGSRFSSFASLENLKKYCGFKLRELIPDCSLVQRSLSSSGSLMIPVGSYFLTMPTQEGRKAVVIFPPGDASLTDIEYMLGAEDVEDGGNVKASVAAKQLDRVLLESDGSYKVLLLKSAKRT